MTQEDLGNSMLSVKKANSRDLRCQFASRSTKQSRKISKIADQSFLYYLKKTIAGKKASTISRAQKSTTLQNLNKIDHAQFPDLEETASEVSVNFKKGEEDYLSVVSLQAFLQDFFLHYQEHVDHESKDFTFLQRLSHSLSLICKERYEDQIRFLTIDTTLNIFTEQWSISVTFSCDRKIKDVKLTTLSKSFFDKFSKNISKLKQDLQQTAQFDEIDFSVVFESGDDVQESKTLKYKLYGMREQNFEMVQNLLSKEGELEINFLV